MRETYLTWFHADDFPFFRSIEEMGGKLSCAGADFDEAAAGGDWEVFEEVVYGGRLVVWTGIVVVGRVGAESCLGCWMDWHWREREGKVRRIGRRREDSRRGACGYCG
jgi:hypothetical protein